ncbi:enoyl-CoA hydratase-related protein [Blastococcus brunescens]|uniref:Enoyl-CoA hydratase-related protein n=1 Tax=Blastococcus brunescens TaxID=1564165 RepID=A0ABZ1B9C7_9ACTN|nr:enoyl-CoA hydratase-related protein [Blastococcus sp. BMG 8361]WRL66533.1 enoyl-CoA hydratase-related protein [Blastococcus sp. BMG 8361]
MATLTLDVAEDGGIVPGYELKMNSYDLGVDIELHDAVQRIRFEHPEAKAIVVTSGKDRMFCAGANIKMLAASPHSWKVNFCKFTNETRNGIEDASAHSGLRSIAAVNGTAAGGGYELALACDEILLVDDNSSSVSLPEVPLLGVLPGTGGLTRVVDKRGVRRDLADIFSTTSEGIKGDRAVQWRLVDGTAKATEFPGEIARRAAEAAATSSRPGAGAQGCSSPRWRARSTATRPGTSTCASSSTASRVPPPSRCSARPPSRTTSTSCTSRATRPGCWPPPGSSTTRSCACAPTSCPSAPGCCAPRATSRPWPRTTSSCSRTATTGWSTRPSASTSGP